MLSRTAIYCCIHIRGLQNTVKIFLSVRAPCSARPLVRKQARIRHGQMDGMLRRRSVTDIISLCTLFVFVHALVPMRYIAIDAAGVYELMVCAHLGRPE